MMENKKRLCIEETCGKEHDGEYNRYYCSEKCKDRDDARDYMMVSARDDVTCPYCKEDQKDIFEGGYYEAEGEEFECDACGKTFILTAMQYTDFTTYPTEEELTTFIDNGGW